MKKKTKEKLIGYLLGIGVIIWLISYLIDFASENIKTIEVLLTYSFFVFLAIYFLYLIIDLIAKNSEKKLEEERWNKIKSTQFSHNRKDYIIMMDDYRRGNPIESYYRKKYFMILLEHYNNKCAKCYSNHSICLDHFVFSKNEGGNFILNSIEGYFINNAIPLCQSCNSKKSDLSYLAFFNSEELVRLFEINKELTLILNVDEQLKKFLHYS